MPFDPNTAILDEEQEIQKQGKFDPTTAVLDENKEIGVESSPNGEIMTPETFAGEQRSRDAASGRVLGNVGQILGGLGGAAAGGIAGHPYIGSAIGGTAGRLAGKLTAEQINQFKGKGIVESIAAGIPLGPLGYPLTLDQMSAEKGEKLGKETVKTAAVEGAIAPIGLGLNLAGKGILKGLLGARTAERGFERGFNKITDKDFFQNRVPKMIAEKTSQFFNRLSQTTGKEVDNLIKVKYKDSSVFIGDLKNDINEIVPPETKYKTIYEYIDNLATKSNVEKDLIGNRTKAILSMGGTKRKISTIWEMRKNLDKLINSKSWSDDGLEYLRSLRKILNEPIKRSGEDIRTAFKKYQFVKEGEYDLGKKFMASRGPDNEIYASPVEGFASEIMSSKKDDLIRRLKALDSLNKADDKVIDEFLDYAAAESLDKNMGFGVFQEMLAGMLGGRRKVAEIGAAMQTPAAEGVKKSISRATPTTISDMWQELDE